MSLDWTKHSGQIEADGVHLEWARWGELDGSKPVIVMLHEGLGCVALWRETPALIATATRCPVFAYSRAGYGQSGPATLPRPIDYMTHEAVNVLPVILDAIGAEHFLLLGHSDGATIAAEYAGRVSDARVRGVILMAPHFFTEPMGLAEIEKARAAFDAGDMAARMGKYHRDPVATFRGWNDAWLNPEFTAWNVADVIGYIRVPALVIQGLQDQYGTRAQVDAIADESYAPVEVELLDDCRHSPHFDQPERVVAAIAEFTTRLRRIEAAEPESAAHPAWS